MLGGIGGRRRRGHRRVRWLDSITDSMDMDLSKLWEVVKDRDLFLHGLESKPGSSLQTEEEAGLP